jgi:protein O-mannosyl-transferase
LKSEIIYTKQPDTLPAFAIKLVKNKATISICCIVLVVITLTVYLQVGNHEFLNFDDDAYVTNNPHVSTGITGKNIIWAFTSVEKANWHPITWISHMADVQMFGMNPRGHHLTSVVIHTLSALILFFLILRLTGALWQSFFVAALFALHPLHVESVAWVAERKDVLSAFFWFLTLFLYAGFVENRKPLLYILALLSFVLGLMSKPMLVTLPIVMLLIDFWPLDRYRCVERQKLYLLFRRLIVLIKEKIPFFACSLLSGIVTIYAQGKVGAMSDLSVVPFQLRIENALIAYVTYIGKTIWPHDLALLYPYPSYIPPWQVISSLLILLIVTSTAIRTRQRHPYFAVGWFWFLITLLPVIGLLQVGSQSMADRYSYIPIIGLFIIAAWGIPYLLKGIRYRQGILLLLTATAIIASSILTWQQIGYWEDSFSIYQHTLRVTTGNTTIQYALGRAFQDRGDLDAAIRNYQIALQINSNNTLAQHYLGVALQAKTELGDLIQYYRNTLQMDPNNAGVHCNLGIALASSGEFDAAIQEYLEALRISPYNAYVHYKLGDAYIGNGDLNAAIQEYQKALQLNPNITHAYYSLRRTLAQKRRQENP